jgi:hypothetical protein
VIGPVLTVEQRNVRAALGTIVHELDGGEGTAVFVTRGYFDTDLSSTVIAVEPDGTVSGWTLRHDWLGDGPGWQKVYAQPTHYPFVGELVLLRTEGRPTWHVGASRDTYDAPVALNVALSAIYGPDLPTEQRMPGGRRHGE